MTGGGPQRLEGPIRRLGVVYREDAPEVHAIIDRMRDWATEHGVTLSVEANAGRGPQPSLDLEATPVDLVVALGGDGTFLRASRLVVGTDVPVLGVNLGRLGFLTAIPDSYLEGGLHQIIAGEAIVEHRFRLRASIEVQGELQDAKFYALNDIVVHTVGAARVTALTLSVGDGTEMEEIGSFAADGVILSTPTGSTAYSMSAGGPIIAPEVDAVVITPICPHSLAVRPLVVPADRVLSVASLDPTADHQLTVDGQVVHHLKAGDKVIVAREPRPLRLVRLPGQTFFTTMRRKLNWAVTPPERT